MLCGWLGLIGLWDGLEGGAEDLGVTHVTPANTAWWSCDRVERVMLVDVCLTITRSEGGVIDRDYYEPLMEGRLWCMHAYKKSNQQPLTQKSAFPSSFGEGRRRKRGCALSFPWQLLHFGDLQYQSCTSCYAKCIKNALIHNLWAFIF